MNFGKRLKHKTNEKIFSFKNKTKKLRTHVS